METNNLIYVFKKFHFLLFEGMCFFSVYFEKAKNAKQKWKQGDQLGTFCSNLFQGLFSVWSKDQ